jgi:hypothetical protein
MKKQSTAFVAVIVAVLTTWYAYAEAPVSHAARANRKHRRSQMLAVPSVVHQILETREAIMSAAKPEPYVFTTTSHDDTVQWSLRSDCFVGDPGAEVDMTTKPIFSNARLHGYPVAMDFENIVNVSAPVSIDMGHVGTMTFEPGVFWQASQKEGLYAALGNMFDGGQASVAKHIGLQSQIRYSIPVSHDVDFSLVYAQLNPRDAFEGLESASRVHYGRAEISARF